MTKKLILAIKVFVRVMQWDAYYNYDEDTKSTILMFKDL